MPASPFRNSYPLYTVAYQQLRRSIRQPEEPPQCRIAMRHRTEEMPFHNWHAGAARPAAPRHGEQRNSSRQCAARLGWVRPGGRSPPDSGRRNRLSVGRAGHWLPARNPNAMALPALKPNLLRPGHIYTLNAAKALGDVLVVVIATGDTAVKMKKRRPLHVENQRQELIGSLSMVDLCIVGKEGDIFKTVSTVRPDIIALGYDQVHQEKFITDGCKAIVLNIRVARLQSPVPEFSSSKIEKEYGEALHGI